MSKARIDTIILCASIDVQPFLDSEIDLFEEFSGFDCNSLTIHDHVAVEREIQPTNDCIDLLKAMAKLEYDLENKIEEIGKKARKLKKEKR